MKYKWKVGDRYYINQWSSGEPIHGQIVSLQDGVYTVEWDDGLISKEKKITPAESFWAFDNLSRRNQGIE